MVINKNEPKIQYKNQFYLISNKKRLKYHLPNIPIYNPT